MILVELYSKEECHLCDEARAVLEKVRQQIPFNLRESKLSPGDEYYDEYAEMFPVVHVNKVLTFKYRVNEHMLRIKLQQLTEGARSPDVRADDSTMEPGT
ncbi:MAG TPA: glutaredoxin family protein [Bacteroidota bacterium]|nr:glutaredoxin family protein [Bacteroidota bacterium]